MVWTGKLVVLKLDGDLEDQGFRVGLEIGTDGDRPVIEVSGRLPPDPVLVTYLNQWQEAYRSMGIASRIMPHEIIYGGSVNQLNDCQTAARALRDRLNTWLESPSFRIIDQRLREALSIHEPIRILIRTQNRHLQRLPWHVWDIVERYPMAEVALGATMFERVTAASAPLTPQFWGETESKSPRIGGLKPFGAYKKRGLTRSASMAQSSENRCKSVRALPNRNVRILAILGNHEGINLDADQRILKQVPDAEVTVLVEPSRQQVTQQLWDSPWHILFFAGHSQTEGCQGRIYLSPTESLTLEELKYGLRQAIAQGLQLAIFNSCDGLGLVRELEPLHLPQMMVMREPVPDPVAQEFLKQFLLAFVRGDPLYLAARQARERLQGLEGDFPCASWLPVIAQNSPDPPPSWHELLEPAPGTAPSASPWKRLRSLALTSCLITGAIAGLRFTGLLQPAELWASDQLMRLRPSEGLDQRILVVKATEQDFQQLNEYPLSDRTVTRLLKTLEQHRPQVIGLDLYRDIPQGTGRQELLNHLQQNASVADSKRPRIIAACKVSGRDDPGIAPPPNLPNQFLGFTDVVVDPNQVIRRQLLSASPKPAAACSTGYALSFLLAADYLEKMGYPNNITAENDWQFGGVVFKRLQPRTGGYQGVDAGGSQVLLNYRTPVEVAQQVTVTKVLTDPNPEYIQNRIILIGVDSDNTDRYLTPYSHGQGTTQTVPGVVIHAQMVSQLISAVMDHRPLLWVWPPWGEVLWIWGWAGVGGVCGSLRSPLWVGLTTGMALIILSGTCLGWLQQGGWIPCVPAAIVLVASSTSFVVYDTLRTKFRTYKGSGEWGVGNEGMRG